jgi:hypothetical protein
MSFHTHEDWMYVSGKLPPHYPVPATIGLVAIYHDSVVIYPTDDDAKRLAKVWL